MNKFFIFILMAFTLASCGDAKFDRIPGQYLDVIPPEVHGKYQYFGRDFKSRLTDTLFLQVGSTEIKLSGSKGKYTYQIHKDFQLHKVKDVYVMGMHDKTIKALWNLTVIEPFDNGLKIHFANEGKMNAEDNGVVHRHLPFQDIMVHHDPLPGAPVPADGAAEVTTDGPTMTRFYNVNEDQFMVYFNEELKGKEYMQLIKDPKDKSTKKVRK
jgi:hypothetical protein